MDDNEEKVWNSDPAIQRALRNMSADQRAEDREEIDWSNRVMVALDRGVADAVEQGWSELEELVSFYPARVRAMMPTRERPEGRSGVVDVPGFGAVRLGPSGRLERL